MNEASGAALPRDPDYVLSPLDVDRFDRVCDRVSRVGQRIDHRCGVEHRVDVFACVQHVGVIANVTTKPPDPVLGPRRWRRVEHVYGAPFGSQRGDEMTSQKSPAAGD